MRYKLAFDTGGTFTDLVMLDEQVGEMAVGKTSTTPKDPAVGVLQGIQELLKREKVDLTTTSMVVGGATTLVTNAIIERKGAKTALITTEGFRDIVEMGREMRYDLYDLFIEMPEPIVSPQLRFGVRERLDKDGNVTTPLDEAGVRAAIREIVAQGAEAVAVCLLHSYQNPVHERRIGEILAAEASDLRVTLSSELVPEIREYERASTTMLNAYVQPLMKKHIDRLEEGLRELGYSGDLYLMLSNGGTITGQAAAQFPVKLIESGPAAGALAAVFYGRLSGEPNLLSFDMGGTTAKACLINNLQPSLSTQFETGRVYQFKKGSGLPVKVPVIEMIEIGAGGGSIARVDELQLLKVGPRSAGAEPGPVAYGRGGTEPTVTDADLVLGYLDPGFFLGGKMQLDVEGAKRAIEERIAKPLKLDVIAAAWGIHEIVNENMAAAARIHIAEHGKDPRNYTLVGFGGAGPVHAQRVARRLRTRRIIIPLAAGVTSAIGLLIAPLALDYVQTYVSRLAGVDWTNLNRLFGGMEAEGLRLLQQAGADPAKVQVARSADMRYVGQGFEINVPLPTGTLTADRYDEILESFYTTYETLYDRRVTDVPVEVLNWRALVSHPAPQLELKASERNGQQLASARKGTRPAFFPEANGFVDTPVYDHYRLFAGATFEGPAIIEERESTSVIGYHQRVTVDEYLNLVVDVDYEATA